MDDSDSDFDFGPKVQVTRKTVSLNNASQVNQLPEECFIPGVTHLIQTRTNSIENSDETICVQHMQLDNNKQVDLKMLRRLIDQFDFLIGYKESDKTELYYTYLQFQQQIKYCKDDFTQQLQQLLDQKQFTQSIEILLKYFKDNQYSQQACNILLQHINSLHQLIEQDTITNEQEKLKLVNSLLILVQLYSEFGLANQTKIIELLIEICHKLTNNCDIMQYIHTIQLICQLHLIEQNTNQQCSQYIDKMVDTLINALSYLKQFFKTQILNDQTNLFEISKSSILLLFNEDLILEQQMFSIQQEYNILSSFQQFHIKISTIISILVAIYFINKNRSPLTGYQSTCYELLSQLLLQKYSQRTSTYEKQSFLIIDDEDNGINNSVVYKSNKNATLNSNEDDSSNFENQQRPVQTKTQLKSFKQPTLINNAALVQVKFQNDNTIQQNVQEILTNNQLILQLLLQFRQNVSCFNLIKVKLDCFFCYQHQSVINIFNKAICQQNTDYLNPSNKINVTLYSQLENITHIVINLLRQTNQNYLVQYSCQNLIKQAFINQFYYLPQHIQICQISLKLLENCLINFQNSINEKIQILEYSSKIMYQINDWCQGITTQIKLLRLIQETSIQLLQDKQDKIVQISYEIGMKLFQYGEYYFAQHYLCYAIEMTSQSQVIHDERKSPNNSKEKPSQQCTTDHTKQSFYEAIQSINLIDQINRSSSSFSSGELSETISDSTFSSHPIDYLSQQAFDIYMSRISCYIKLNDFQAALKILNRLNEIIDTHDIMKLYILFRLCQTYITISANQCQIHYETFQQLNLLLVQFFSNRKIFMNYYEIMFRCHLLLSQYFLKCGFLNEALILCLSLYFFTTQDIQELQQYNINFVSEIQLHFIEILKYLVDQSVRYQTSQNRSNNLFSKKQQDKQIFTTDFPTFGTELINAFKDNIANDGQVDIILIEINDNNIVCQVQSELVHMQLMLSTCLDVIKTIDSNNYRQNKYEAVTDMLYYLVHSKFCEINQQDKIQLKKLNCKRIYIQRVNGKILLGFKTDGQLISFDTQFKNTIIKETTTTLSNMYNIELKAKLLLSYCQYLLILQKCEYDVGKIMENVIQFVYSTYMCGCYTLAYLYEFPQSQLIQIKQLYQQITIISLQMKPTPKHLVLFIDALNNLEYNIQNTVQKKNYPDFLQNTDISIKPSKEIESLITEQYSNLSNNVISTLQKQNLFLNNFENIQEQQINLQKEVFHQIISHDFTQVSDTISMTPSNKQSEFMQINQNEIKSRIQQFIKEHLPSTLPAQKQNNIGLSKMVVQMCQALQTKNYSRLINFYKLYQSNRQEFTQNCTLQVYENYQTQQKINSKTIQYLMFNQEFNNVLGSSNIQNSELIRQQTRVQEIANASDIIRTSLSQHYNIDFSQNIDTFISNYYNSQNIHCCYFILLLNQIFHFDKNGKTQAILKLNDNQILNSFTSIIDSKIVLKNISIFEQNYECVSNQVCTEELPQQLLNTGEIILSTNRTKSTTNQQLSLDYIEQLRKILNIYNRKMDDLQVEFGVESCIFDMNALLSQHKVVAQQAGDKTVKNENENAEKSTKLFWVIFNNLKQQFRQTGQVNSIVKQHDNIVISSLPLQMLPFDQMFNICQQRSITQFQFIVMNKQKEKFNQLNVQLAKTIKQYIDIKLYFASIQSNELNYQQYQQKLQVQAHDISQHHNKDKTQQSKQKLSKQDKQQISFLEKILDNIQCIEPIQLVHFSHAVEARGRKFSQQENNRKAQLYDQVKSQLTVLTHNNEKNHMNEQTHPLYCNYEGIQTPFQSELLLYGTKDISQQLRKQLNQTVQVIDVSECILQNQFLILKHLPIFNDINSKNMITQYNNFILNQNQKKTEVKELRRSNSTIFQHQPIIFPEIIKLQNFIDQEDFQNQLKLIENKNNTTLVYNYHKCTDIQQFKVVIISFADLECQCDLVHMILMQQINTIVAPGEIIEQITIFISNIVNHLIQMYKKEDDNYQYLFYLLKNPKILVQIFTFIVRRVFCCPIAYF